MSEQLGELTPKKFSNSLNKLKSNLQQAPNKTLHTKIKSLTEINKKVSDSYTVSLKIIVDVSKLLNQYMLYFNEIEKIIQGLEKQNNTNALNEEYFTYINKMTSEKIENLSDAFRKQLSTLKPIYSKNNISTTDLDTYDILLKEISQESKTILEEKK